MIRFTKMHGLGNDYVYVDCFEQDLGGVDVPALARAMSDRHRGIGSDGLILIRPPSRAGHRDEVGHARMEMYNADGSRGEMCGNGIRCVAKYLVDRGLVSCGTGDRRELKIVTDRGTLSLWAMLRDGRVHSVRVDMGVPILRPSEIPVTAPGERCVRRPVDVAGRLLELTCVSMGNPHAVAFVDDIQAVDLKRLGPLVERNPVFPNRTNFHIVRVATRQSAWMRTWERGSGVTMACGTGACAVLVAGVLDGRLDRRALLHLPGGELEVEWPDVAGGSVFMTGPAVEVFSGQWPT